MQRLVITGAGRGIGLELARHYLERGDYVVAGCRNLEGAPALRALLGRHEGKIQVVTLETTDLEAVIAAEQQVRAAIGGVDVLINNAAIQLGDPQVEGGAGLPFHDPDAILAMLRVNTIAPLLIAQIFVGLLRVGTQPRVVNISSHLGSLTLATSGGDYGYSASKAALNMLTRRFAADVRGLDITAVALDPGWVQTDMGGRGAPLTPTQSAHGILAVIDGLTLSNTGRYLRYDGSEVPW